MNNCVFSGRLTRDPELRQTNTGLDVCNFSLAVDRPRVKDRVDFFDFVAWGNTAKFIDKYFNKGKQILLTAVAQQERWEKDGQKHSKTVFNVQGVEFMGFENKNNEASDQEANDSPVDDGETVPF